MCDNLNPFAPPVVLHDAPAAKTASKEEPSDRPRIGTAFIINLLALLACNPLGLPGLICALIGWGAGNQETAEMFAGVSYAFAVLAIITTVGVGCALLFGVF